MANIREVMVMVCYGVMAVLVTTFLDLLQSNGAFPNRWLSIQIKGFINETPSIYKGIFYLCTFEGVIFAVKEKHYSDVWTQNLKEMTGLNNASGIVINGTLEVTRFTPTIAGDYLIVGIYGPPMVIGLRRDNGKLVWMTKLDNHSYSLITMSGTYYNGAFYVGVSSLKELAPVDQCCTFRGSFAKLDVHTGKIIWQTYMLPDNKGKRGEYSGAALWASSPSVDTVRNNVYIATGNLHSVPEEVEKCQEKKHNNRTFSTHSENCIDPEIHFNSILALDIETVKIKWYHQLGGHDVWFMARSSGFTDAPHLWGEPKDYLLVVHKSGIRFLDRDNGDLIWSKEAGFVKGKSKRSRNSNKYDTSRQGRSQDEDLTREQRLITYDEF